MTAWLLYALICLIWGSTWLAIKVGLEGVPPFLGAGLRFLIASSVFFIWNALRGGRLRLERDDKICVASAGILSFTFGYALVYWAEQHITSGLTAILYSTMPLMVALLSRFWMQSERITLKKLCGIFIGIAGTLFLFWPQERMSALQYWAMAGVLASVVTAAVNLVILKKYSQKSDIFALNAFAMLIGTVLLLGSSFVLEAGREVSFNRSNVLALIYLALMGSVVTFATYYHLIKVMPATVLSMITLIIPVVAVLLGWALLHETLELKTWAGMALVLGGSAFALAPSAELRGPGCVRDAADREDAPVFLKRNEKFGKM